MPISQATYTGDGVTTDFAIPYPYIDRLDIVVFVGGVTQTQGTDYTFTTNSAITLGAAPGSGVAVSILRLSGIAGRKVTFPPGAGLTTSGLDKSTLQLFYLAQEMFDVGTDASVLITALTARVTTLETQAATLISSLADLTGAVTALQAAEASE
jgi:hypothetical protein